MKKFGEANSKGRMKIKILATTVKCNAKRSLVTKIKTTIERAHKHNTHHSSGGGGAIRTLERETLTDLQSASFSHLDTPPKLN